MNTRPWLLILLTFITPREAEAKAEAVDHHAFDAILRAHVDRGRVDYGAIKKQRTAELSAYLKMIAEARPEALESADKLAFYLNAYNALVIKAVVDRWPRIESVRQVDGFFDRLSYRVGRRKLTLNQLENRVIRPTFKDPRIHFALVCAARSCPPLGSAAFEGASVDRVLTGLTSAFINSSAGVQIKDGRVRVSQLFNWYRKDFVGEAGTVGEYLARYHKKNPGLLKKSQKLDPLDYNWSLNKR